MAHSLAQIYVHVVFHIKTTKIKREHLPRLWAYLAGVCRGLGCYVVEIGGEVDHVHILCTQPRNISPAEMLEEIKRNSSHWIKSIDASYSHFTWQRGYAMFSVSQSKVETVTQYIRNQEEHHKRITFQDEYVQWLKEYNIEYDEKYLWSD